MQTKILFLAGAMLALFSCSKKSSNSTTSVAAELTGTWKISQFYVDLNNNGVMDATEKITDTSFANEIMKVNADGTYSVTYYSLVTNGTWSLLYNNTYIKSTDTATKYYNIVTITNNAMELKDTTGVASGANILWFFYVKQ